MNNLKRYNESVNFYADFIEWAVIKRLKPSLYKTIAKMCGVDADLLDPINIYDLPLEMQKELKTNRYLLDAVVECAKQRKFRDEYIAKYVDWKTFKALGDDRE